MKHRFEYYCAHLTRTYFINPSSYVQKVYQLALDVQQQVMKELRDGVALKDVYQSAVQFIQEDTPALLKYFTKNCGFATGIGLRDSTHVISTKCSRTASKNMTFVVTVGFENVPMVLTESEKKKKSDGARGMKLFTCAVGDTVVVGMKHQNSEAWTTKAKSGALFFFLLPSFCFWQMVFGKWFLATLLALPVVHPGTMKY